MITVLLYMRFGQDNREQFRSEYSLGGDSESSLGGDSESSLGGDSEY